MQPILKISHLTKSYSNRENLIQDFSLDLFENEIISIVGPSGSGKSTILKMIGGHEKSSSGNIYLMGKDITNIPAFRREINTVFQDLALFPHLSVKENISFPLKMKGLNKSLIETKVNQMMINVQLNNQGNVSIDSLSGGEQQRVAIARSVIGKPKVLLCDEPLSKLDNILKEDLLNFLIEFFIKQKMSIIYVTHDQEEAILLSDKIIVINEGKIIQSGKPDEILSNPVDSFVAKFFRTHNIFELKRNQKGYFENDFIKFESNSSKNKLLIGISLDKFQLSDENHTNIINKIQCQIISKINKNNHINLRVLVSNQIIYVRLPLSSKINNSKGESIYLYYNVKDIKIFET